MSVVNDFSGKTATFHPRNSKAWKAQANQQGRTRRSWLISQAEYQKELHIGNTEKSVVVGECLKSPSLEQSRYLHVGFGLYTAKRIDEDW